MNEQPRKPRLTSRFTVRTMLVLIGVLAVLLGVRANHARHQRRLVQRVLEWGGTVTYTCMHDETGKYDENTKPIWPTWLMRLVGDDFFLDVSRVHGLKASQASRADFAEFLADGQHLAELRHLHLFFSDGEQVRLVGQRLHQLESLHLYEPQADDEMLKDLAKLPRLKSLIIEFSEITGDGFNHFHPSSHLEVLALMDGDISDSGLKAIARLKHLRKLGLHQHESLTDDGLEALASMQSLEKLGLSCCVGITKAGFVRLRELSNLCELREMGGFFTLSSPTDKIPQAK